MPLSPGQVLNNRYRIVRLLGQGGFGAVYRAWDSNLETARALKENLDTSPEAQRQFKREAQILDKLSHPNLPKVIDHFVISGQGQYLVMEFIEGEDLGTLLEKACGPLPEAQALPWIGQVCDALDYLHSQTPPIIHRDIKPANIKITPQGKAMLVDFGIAKVYELNMSTTAGARAVTPGYSPQEQYGLGATDARTDIYALGATLYHLLTGKQPPESVQRTIGVALEPPIKLNPVISKKTQTAILKAMESLPGKRFQSSVEFRQALLGKGEAPQPMQVQRQAVKNVAVPGSSPPGSAAPSAPQPLPWKWIGTLAALGLVLLLVYIFSGVGKKEVSGLSAASDTATSPVVAVIATTRIPLSPTLSPATSSNTPAAPPTSTNTPLAFNATPAETSTPAPLAEQIIDEQGTAMNLVPAGTFLMGVQEDELDALMRECSDIYSTSSCTNRYATQTPAHLVYLSNYYMDRTEVTNAAYARCVNAGACQPPILTNSLTRDPYFGNPTYDNYPVVYIDWERANTFCQWRNARLPTEAEWEKAARGEDGRLFPWGDDPIDGTRANYCDKHCTMSQADLSNDDGYGDTSPVGSYPDGASPYGIFDMVGNASEWVADWYQKDYYTISPLENPAGPASGDLRGVRGGSFQLNYLYLHVTSRSTGAPVSSSGRNMHHTGFRCARSIDAGTTTPETEAPVATQVPTIEPGGTATQATLPAQIVDDFDVPMALVPEGEFKMGIETEVALSECQKYLADCSYLSEPDLPIHAIYLDSYYIDAYEVTNALYENCVSAGACSKPGYSGSVSRTSYYGNPEFANYPVVHVTWEMANTFCNWRETRLPTEAEWEKAARGGLENKLYPWGDEAPVCQKGANNGAKFDDDNLCNAADTEPVGNFASNGFGLFDLAGNVAEWVFDWYDKTFYGISPYKNPVGPENGSYHVVRGGSYWSQELYLLVAFRTGMEYARSSNIGFRCARTP